jgi:hypothetical protein
MALLISGHMTPWPSSRPPILGCEPSSFARCPSCLNTQLCTSVGVRILQRACQKNCLQDTSLPSPRLQNENLEWHSRICSRVTCPPVYHPQMLRKLKIPLLARPLTFCSGRFYPKGHCGLFPVVCHLALFQRNRRRQRTCV